MTTSSVEQGHDVDVGYVLEVPEKPNGPAVRALLRRTGIAAAIGGAAAAAVSTFSKRPADRALALGALAPFSAPIERKA